MRSGGENVKSKNKHIWKMGGSMKFTSPFRLFCYVECARMDDAFRIARSTFGEREITSAQPVAHDEQIDETLPYFSIKGGEQE